MQNSLTRWQKMKPTSRRKEAGYKINKCRCSIERENSNVRIKINALQQKIRTRYLNGCVVFFPFFYYGALLDLPKGSSIN